MTRRGCWQHLSSEKVLGMSVYPPKAIFYWQICPSFCPVCGLQVNAWMEWGFSDCPWWTRDPFSECITKTALPQRPSLWSHFLINMGFVIIVSFCWQNCSWRPQAACSWNARQSKHTLWLLLASDGCSFWVCALATLTAITVMISIYCSAFHNSSKDI